MFFSLASRAFSRVRPGKADYRNIFDGCFLMKDERPICGGDNGCRAMSFDVACISLFSVI